MTRSRGDVDLVLETVAAGTGPGRVGGFRGGDERPDDQELVARHLCGHALPALVIRGGGAAAARHLQFALKSRKTSRHAERGLPTFTARSLSWRRCSLR